MKIKKLIGNIACGIGLFAISATFSAVGVTQTIGGAALGVVDSIRYFIDGEPYASFADNKLLITEPRLVESKKPVIYVYNDTDDANLSISITSADNTDLDITYPVAIDNTWDITSDKYSNITVDETNVRYIYWEDTMNIEYSITEGYCIRGTDTIEFLEYALTELGLTDKEQDDFITYWLPQMQNNAYNIISFNPEEYFKAYRHIYDRTPDNEITAFMVWKPSDKYVELQAQDLLAMNNHSRDGLVIVEWGGTKLEASN